MSKFDIAESEQQIQVHWRPALEGDAHCYRRALTLIADRLRSYFRSRMRDSPQDVEELVQECLLAIHVQRDTYDLHIPVTAWMHAIARYKLIDYWRRIGRERQMLTYIDDLPPEDEPVSPEFETQMDLRQLLEQLPESMRNAIEDTKIQGLTVAETAKRRGISESAVKVNVHRGLKRLSKMLGIA